jgi:hypothetical protein
MNTDTTQSVEQVQRLGLSKSTIEAAARYIWGENFIAPIDIRRLIKFAQAIERAHGIIE